MVTKSAEDIEAEKARADRAKARAKALVGFSKDVAEWLVANDCDTPASIPATAVEAMRAKAGL